MLVGLTLFLGDAVLAAPVGAAPSKRTSEKKVAAERTQLLAPDIAAATAAATKLGTFKNPSAVTALADALDRGHDEVVAKAAIQSLGAHADQRAQPILVIYAQHRSDVLRLAAVNALASLPSLESVQALTIRLVDSAAIRSRAATILGEFGPAVAESAAMDLARLLKTGDLAVAQAAGLLGDEAVAKFVKTRILIDPDPAVALALGTLLRRPDFAPSSRRTELAEALGTLPKGAGLDELRAYIAEFSGTEGHAQTLQAAETSIAIAEKE